MTRGCIEAGCPNLAAGSHARCRPHHLAWDRKRQGKRGDLYKGGWRKQAGDQVRQEPQCAECGSEADLTADHIVPNDPESPLRTLCRSCNSARANRMRAIYR